MGDIHERLQAFIKNNPPQERPIPSHLLELKKQEDDRQLHLHDPKAWCKKHGKKYQPGLFRD